MAMANGVTTTADAEMLAATAADLTTVASLKAADAPKVAVTAVDVEMPAVDVAAEMIVVTGVDAETTVDAIVAEDAPRSNLIRP